MLRLQLREHHDGARALSYRSRSDITQFVLVHWAYGMVHRIVRTRGVASSQRNVMSPPCFTDQARLPAGDTCATFAVHQVL
jgi:hypothetical protein